MSIIDRSVKRVTIILAWSMVLVCNGQEELSAFPLSFLDEMMSDFEGEVPSSFILVRLFLTIHLIHYSYY